MPRWCSSAPRKKSPPPMTTAICAPVATTSAICRATASTTTGSTPTAPPPNISPPSLSNTRRKPGREPSRMASTRSGLADLEAGEILDRQPGCVHQGLDGLLRVLDRGLLEQHDVLVVAVDAAVHDPGQHLLGLALLACRRLGDAALVVEQLRRDLVAGGEAGPRGGDVHRDTACGVGVGALVGHQHADRGRQVRGAAVQVERDGAVDRDVALELELLADTRGQGLHGVLDGALAELRGAQAVEVGGLLVQRDLQDLVGQRLEVAALGHEVRLAVQLDHRAAGGDDQAVAGGALGALADILRALDAQQLDGLLDVAVGLLERPLAVHHPGAGELTEPLHVGGGVVRHRGSLTSLSEGVRRATGWKARSGGDRRGHRTAVACPVPAGCQPAVCWVPLELAAAAAGAAAGSVASAAVSGRLAPSEPVPLVSSSCSHSASGSSVPVPASAPSPRARCERAISPSAAARAITLVSSAAERIASSLPGIG